MLKRHFFLVAAGVLLGLMVIAAVIRIAFAQEEGAGPGGPGGGPGGGGGRGQAVAAVSAQPRPFSNEIRVLGVARGLRSVNITSPTSELITRVLFRDGQAVRAGQPLVELQAREEDAGIIEQRAQLNQAQREYDRTKTLVDRGVAPRVMLEQSETALQTARANLQAAQARRGDRMIRAPFSGVLGLTNITAGTLVNPGAVIATLDDVSAVRVDFPVPERYLGVLRPGTPITATADAYGGETFPGRIALVDTRVNEQTRSVTARAEFANPGGRIRPGMSLRIAVQEGSRMSPAVPEAAVQYEGGNAFVFRVAQTEGGTRTQRVEVETGAVEAGFVEILSGLSAGDQVVANGLNRIQPNAPIRVAGAAGGAGAGSAGPQTKKAAAR